MVHISLLLNSVDELKQLLGQVIDEKIKNGNLLVQTYSNPETEFLTIAQTLQFLHISKPTLNKLRREGKVREISSSDKRILFKKSDLISYLNKNLKS